jgi:hypothetical protein
MLTVGRVGVCPVPFVDPRTCIEQLEKRGTAEAVPRVARPSDQTDAPLSR